MYLHVLSKVLHTYILMVQYQPRREEFDILILIPSKDMNRNIDTLNPSCAPQSHEVSTALVVAALPVV